MTDLLTPEEVRSMDTMHVSSDTVERLRQNYLTLWDMYNNLWEAVGDFAAAAKKSNPTGNKAVVKLIDEFLNWPSK